MKLDKKIITLLVEEDLKINYNYNYSFMKELYKLMSSIDSKRTKDIHENGFKIDNKIYKLFNFQIYFEGANYNNENIEVKKNSLIKLNISGVTSVLNLIFKGILKNGGIEIDGHKFKINNVEDDKKIKFNKIMLYKVRSPIVESIYNSEMKKAEFLNPYDERYYNALGKNLLRKHKIIYGKEYTGDLFFEIEDFIKIKKKFIKDINKNGFVMGFTDFEIYIEADPEMQKIAYMIGLGQNNSIGMGNISYICGRRE